MRVIPDPWWTAWVLDAPALTALAGVLALYLRGARMRRLRQAPPRPGRTAAFVAGWTVTLAALVTPVAAWSELLLTAHMVQHLLLVVVAAPLLALGAPVTTIRASLPARPRRALVSWSRASRRLRRRTGLPHPIVLATAAHVLALWVWHAPGAYDLAVRNAGVHLLEHVSFLATGVWVWAEVVATARRAREAQALATLCLAALIAQGGVLGALLVFAGRSLYTVYEGAAGLTALEDQQLAGALMWVPPSVVYAAAAIRRFVAWLDASDRDLRERERRERARVRAPLASTSPRDDRPV